jgi:hypothetical protein
MFDVQITDEAKLIVEQQIALQENPKTGLMIHRQGIVGDNFRTVDGENTWEIKRHHPWAVAIGSYAEIPDSDESIIYVSGIRVWLPLIPRPNEGGVIVSVKEGQLYVTAISA